MKVTLILKSGFRYSGTLENKDETFFYIFDEKSQRKIQVAINSIEVVQEVSP
jgi:small nuclear ribonucleoprotein (snRNP)-like protein